MLNTTVAPPPEAAFEVKSDVATGRFPLSVTVRDLNADGRPDLAVVNGVSNSVSVMLNQTPVGVARPVFSTATDFPTNPYPQQLTISDFNGDGRPDLAVGNSYSSNVSILLNSTPPGASIPSFSQSFATTGQSKHLVVSDLNGDGKPDLITSGWNSAFVSVVLNTTSPGSASASFGPETNFNLGGVPNSITIGDLNGDGRPDMVSAQSPSAISVFLNTTVPGSATPSFASKTDFPIGTTPASIVIADLNGDGNPDLAVAKEWAGGFSIMLNATAPGSTTPAFMPKTDFGLSAYPTSLVVGDMNNDGRSDLAVTDQNSSQVNVFINTTAPGSSTPTLVLQSTLATAGIRSLALGDFNLDGQPDLVAASLETKSLSVLMSASFTIRDAEGVGTITNDDNDPPSAVTLTNGTNVLPESTDTSVPIVLADIVVTDDNLGTNDLSLTGPDANAFEMVASRLRLKSGIVLDYEVQTAYYVTVNVNDPAVASNPDATVSYTLTVTPVNDNNPVFTCSESRSVPENTTAVGSVTATDADLPAQTVSYSLTGGADQALFSITNGGVLAFKTAPDFEAPTDSGADNAYNVQVTASDGAGGTTVQNLVITVTGANENPVFTSSAAVSVGENSLAVTTVAADDPDFAESMVAYTNFGPSDSFGPFPAYGVQNFTGDEEFRAFAFTPTVTVRLDQVDIGVQRGFNNPQTGNLYIDSDLNGHPSGAYPFGNQLASWSFLIPTSDSRTLRTLGKTSGFENRLS